MANSNLQHLLGDQAAYLLDHQCTTVDKSMIHAPGPDFIDRIWSLSNRNNQVLRSLQTLHNHGRLGGSGYLSILPVDQGIEHSAGASFAPNPIYFDPEKIIELAIEAGCNAVASTFGVLSTMSRKYAHKIPFIVKINHNELLSVPESYDQIMFGSVEDAWNMGAVAVGATIYFGSPESNRQIVGRFKRVQPREKLRARGKRFVRQRRRVDVVDGEQTDDGGIQPDRLERCRKRGK